MMLDEERLEALRSWGERLRQSDSEESVAVGRAILMLVEEIDRLHVELWHARLQPSEQTVAGQSTSESEKKSIASALHARVTGALRRGSHTAPAETVEVPEPSVETDRTNSAQAWIDALRRME
jgi:hypothetical protein